jgi:radical SAM protein with 4Fe4S-binding SPASM domain
VFTNARRITQRLAGVLARVPPLLALEVTVYGMHRRSYEAVSRSPGSFAQFRRGVGLLSENGVPFVVKGAVLPPNRHELEEFEAWARTIPGMAGRPAYSLFLDLRHRRDDPAKNRLIESLRVSPEDGVSILARDEAAYRKEMTEFARKFMGTPDDHVFRCGVGRRISIDAYGKAQPCLGLRAPEMTVDVLSDSLSTALVQFERLNHLRASNPDYLRRCAVCSLGGFCEQCPAKSWMDSGTLDTPVEYLCRVAHAQARFLGWLRDDEHAWETKVDGRIDD